MLGPWLAPLISVLGSVRDWGRETEHWISFSCGCGRRDVGDGSPPPSPSHSLMNSGEGEARSPDFQGYLKAVQTRSFYYPCQSAALDNSLPSTLSLKFEDFRIKKKKNGLSGWGPKHGAGRPSTAPTRRLCPSGAPAGGHASYPIVWEMQSVHMLRQLNPTV